MPVLGIDIGLTGAVALLDNDGKLLAVDDMPVLADGPAKRRTINPALLTEIIYKHRAEIAYVELVGPRPGEGAVGAFAFGRSRGIVEGVLAACGVPIKLVTPAHWKRIVGLPPGEAKDLARSAALKRWPTWAEAFARIKDHGRAEACLIAVAGITVFNGPGSPLKRNEPVG